MLASHKEISKVSVYTFDGNGPTKQNGVTINRYSAPSIFSFEILNTYAYFKLRSRLDDDGVDILHSYNMRLHPVVGHLSNKLSIPSVASLNSYAFIPYRDINIPVNNLLEIYKTMSKKTAGPILRNRMRNIDSFIAISSTVANIYYDEMFPNQNIETIPNMYEPDMFESITEDNSTVNNTMDEVFDILYVGSLRETKGVEYLVKAATHLPTSYQISIAGGGKNKPNLQQLSKELNVDEQVTFFGRVPHKDIKKLYAQADLFVHPGIWPEPFGRTILEAMQYRLPVVATNIGGPAEVIPHEECLCNPEDEVALARTIKRVLSNSTNYGKKNHIYVQQTYSPDVVIPKILDVYKSISSSD
ncbi:glycosyltransferase family 4 protein [Haloarcula marismortui]|nr:glycosyltransferase family 4 protein [Haloarcula sinaiiensis]